MCGICGIINLNREQASEVSVRNMMQLIKHRGPDDEGVFIEDIIGLGFVRLSIIDLSAAGHQPMITSDDKYVIVFNGEIYNYIELREELKSLGHNFRTNTDTEVLLTSWLQWGEDCLHRFNGMWAFLIYDRIDKKIFASRDRYGVKPFYYYLTDSFLAFASEIPPLLTLIKGRPLPDYQSVFEYLVFNRTDQTGHTFFNEIRKLQHGNCLSFSIASDQNPQPRIKRWYNLRENISKTTGFKGVEEYRELLISSIGLRLRSDVPVGVCLSGGLDSSTIVSVLLKEFNKHDLNTFSAVYNQNQAGDESAFIKLYERDLKNMFYTTPDGKSLMKDLSTFVKTQAEPVGSASPYAQYKVMELAGNHVVVTLDGQGADEQLAGYHYFYGFFFKDLLKRFRFGKLSYELLQYTIKHKSLFGIKSFSYFLLPKNLRTKARAGQNSFIHSDFVYAHKNSSVIAGDLYGSLGLNDSLINHFEYKLEHLLKWEDRNSMHFSIEARVPFLDYRLVEKTLATSDELMIKAGMTKHLLRESTKGLLPEAIRMRKDKIGFGTPADEWFRSDSWEKLITDLFNSESFRNRKFINSGEAKKLYCRHVSGKSNEARNIWKLVNLELWFREFID